MKYIHKAYFFTFIMCIADLYAMQEPQNTPDTQYSSHYAILFSPKLKPLLNAFNLWATTPAAIVQETQKTWLRPAGSERWHAPNPYADRKEELMHLLKELELVDEIKPAHKEYDYLLIMGALHARAQKRIEHAVALWNEGYRFKQIILLGSERPLDPEKEPADGFTTPSKPHTEFQMLLHCFGQTAPQEMQAIAHYINAPNTIDSQGKSKRATTGDTVKQWLQTEPAPGRCLVVSNQPHTRYQETITRALLPDNFIVEGCGQSLDAQARMSEILDALARWLYSAYDIYKNHASHP